MDDMVMTHYDARGTPCASDHPPATSSMDHVPATILQEPVCVKIELTISLY